MIYSPGFTAVLDACVLYPAPIRDILLNLADLDIYSPKWSEIIQEEWIRNLLENRPDLSKPKMLQNFLHRSNILPADLARLGEGVPDALPSGKRLSRSEDGDSLHPPPPSRARGGARVVFAVAGDGRRYVEYN